MTKAVVSVAAMMLVEEGKLGLDVPASKYIPALGKMTVDEKTQDCEMTRPKKNLATRAANHCSSTMNFVRKSPGSSKTGRRLGTFSAEISTTAKPNQRLPPLRSGPRAASKPSRQKQIPSSRRSARLSPCRRVWTRDSRPATRWVSPLTHFPSPCFFTTAALINSRA